MSWRLGAMVHETTNGDESIEARMNWIDMGPTHISSPTGVV